MVFAVGLFLIFGFHYTYDYSNGYIIANLNSLNNYVNLIGHLSFSISY
jgi:hypothetical protein